MSKRYTIGGIAGLLRSVREERGLTQSGLGRIVGRSQSHVSHVELGWGYTSPRFLDAAAHALGYRWALIPLEADDAQD